MLGQAGGPSPSRILVGALVLAAAACGARGALPGVGGGSGEGGGPNAGGGPSTSGGPGTGGGAGGDGGSGGAPSGFCPALIAVEPTLELPAPSPSDNAGAPLLLRLTEGRVLVLAGFTPAESPGPVPTVLAGVALEPWGSWPPAAGPHSVFDTAADSAPFTARREPQGETLALAFQRFPTNAPPGCQLGAYYGLSPDAPPGPTALQLLLNGSCDDAPIAIATAGNGLHFVANDIALLPGVRGVVAHVLDASGAPVHSLPPLCASTRIPGDVLPREQRFLFAHAAGDPDECFGAPNALPGPGRRLLLRRISADEDETTELYAGTDDLVDVRLLPRADGAWLLARESGASALVAPPGFAMRLGPGDAVGDPFEVTATGSDRMAAAALGDGFVTAFTDSIDPSAPTVILRVFSPEGAASAEASFSTNGAWFTNQRLALLGAPGPGSILVAWVGQPSGDGPQSLLLRRYDCVGGGGE